MEKQQSVRVLVNQAKEGDRASFEKLVQRYQERLLASIRGRLGQARELGVDAEDILNETLLRAFESLERFSWEGEDFSPNMPPAMKTIPSRQSGCCSFAASTYSTTPYLAVSRWLPTFNPDDVKEGAKTIRFSGVSRHPSRALRTGA